MKDITVSLMLRVVLLTIVVHAVALLGPILIMKATLSWLASANLLRILLGSILLTTDLVALFVSCTLVTGLTSRLLKLRYQGSHDLSVRIPDVRRWLYHMAVYFPTAVLLDLLHLYPFKTLHARLFGAHIGQNVVLAGLILDPCLCTIADGSHIGGFSVIFGHSAEADRQRIIFAPVHIGKHCAVGARAVIMPGARMEDSSRLGPQSLLLQMQTLTAQTVHLGVPGRRIFETQKPVEALLRQEMATHE